MQNVQHHGYQDDESTAAKKEMQQMPEEKAEYAIDHADQHEDRNHPKNQADVDHRQVNRHFIPFIYAV
jgi:hypothetical protein